MIDFKTLKRNLKKDFSNLPSVKVSLLGDSATQFLATSIKGFGVELGYNIDLFEAEYNQVERQLLDSTSDFYRYDAKYTIIFQSTHKLLEKYAKMTFEEQSGMANDRLDFIRSICSLVSSKIIYYNYPEIDDSVFGSYSNKVVASFTYQLRKLNYELMNLSQEFPNFFICDLSALQNKLGRDKMFDANVYVGTDMLLSIDALPYVAARTMDIIASIEGKFKKCLILDLDNTIWGGVVGDEGWENIQVGHGLGIGKAYTELQEWVKKLKNRGIIIAVCSKNDEEKAKEMEQKFRKNSFGFDDYLESMNQMKNMGGISSVLNMIPGIGGQVKDIENMVDEKDMARKEAMILSMTPRERSHPEILTPQRKARIAKGAGVDVAEVNRLVKQFEQAKKMMKQMPGLMNGKGAKRGKFKLPF